MGNTSRPSTPSERADQLDGWVSALIGVAAAADFTNHEDDGRQFVQTIKAMRAEVAALRAER